MKRLYYEFILNPKFLGTFIILVVALIFFAVSLIVEKRQRFTTTPRANSESSRKIIPNINFSNLDEISITPRRVNDYLFSPQLENQYRTIFTNLSPKELHTTLVQHVITWAALRDFFSTNQVSVEGISDTNSVTAAQIEEELPSLTEAYNQKAMKLSGFFVRIRFQGIYQENLDELGIASKELQPQALTLIQKFIDQAKLLDNPENILASVNTDATAKLMNNGELSQSFTDYQLDPPLFDDPNFYEMIEAVPIQEFSQPTILKTMNPLKSGLEEYAYVSFYISEKTGTYLPIPQIVEAYVKVAAIR